MFGSDGASIDSWAQLVSRWPGKSGIDSGPVHPAVHHMLDVAAVAEKVIDTSLQPDRREAFILLIALHDLGKISSSFKAMLETGSAQGKRHWEISEALLWHHDNSLEVALKGTLGARRQLVAAASGHHGRPPTANLKGGFVGRDDLGYMLGLAGESAKANSRAVIEAFASLWPRASLDIMRAGEAKRLSWQLSGLTVASDWIGSNTAWFPAVPQSPDPETYLEQARQKAEFAVREAGMLRAAPRRVRQQLFTFQPRPMQAATAELSLTDGPMLAILEDETGSGKTEAALILADRMLAAGKCKGLFFALPTMATSDAMFARLQRIAGTMFDSPPSLALAHGRANLSSAFQKLVSGRGRNDDVTSAPWLADSRRRAVLAQVGVGTIDQLLLGVLPTRFGTLRLWGLVGKILIVDEAHEMGGDYMAPELAQLLHVHAAQGGSAIVMTATLPLAQRQLLLDAFESGAGREASAQGDPAYPALTVSQGIAPAIAAPEAGRGRVAVKRLATAEDAVRVIHEGMSAGAACVWIRDAVDDAIDAVALLRERGIDADLLHARFTLVDRTRIETTMLDRFGRNGSGRAGRVLVATQIIEASLDLDFDVMVSDLAPMASLVQRAGRLWRHMDLRPLQSRPMPGPVLHVLSPDPGRVEDGLWLRQVLPRGAFVYPLAEQWRTARVLFATGCIDAAGDLRRLIEAVHGSEVEPVPEVLEAAEAETLATGMAERSQSTRNLIVFADGFRALEGAGNDAEYPTRLGTEQLVLVLARMGKGVLRPWADGEGNDAWMRSEVQAARRRLEMLPLTDQSDPELAPVLEQWPEWKQTTHRLCPVGEDGVICPGLRYDSGEGLVFEP